MHQDLSLSCSGLVYLNFLKSHPFFVISMMLVHILALSEAGSMAVMPRTSSATLEQ